MGRICKMSKTSVKSFIDSISRKVSNVFEQDLMNLHNCVNDVDSVCRNFTNWVYPYIAENEHLIADALDYCNHKKDHVQSIQASTPAVVKREQIQVEKVRNQDGAITEKKVSKIIEEPNPQCDINRKAISFLSEQQQRLHNLSEACGEHRRTVDLIVDRVQLFIARVGEVEESISKCQELINEHAEQLTSYAESAYQTLCLAMDGTSAFSAMHDNDGYIDISGVYDYCYKLQLELESIEKKLDALQKASAELKSSWNDQVYEHFNNGIVNAKLPDKLNNALCRTKIMKNDLEEMCDILDKYYNSEISIKSDEIHFSYDYIGIDEEVYRFFSSTFTI